MKVLFLDMDGVMNSRSSRNKGYQERKHTTDKEGWDFPAQPMIDNFNMIIEATGAKVVISSSWRYFHSIESMRNIFKHVGMNCEIIGETPKNTLYTIRGQEIEAWLKEHPEVTSFAIVDDSSDMQPVAKNFVQTSDLRGLENKHSLKLIKILNEAA